MKTKHYRSNAKATHYRSNAKATHYRSNAKATHDGDCTIYASLINNTPESGICTCGYGWELVRKGNWEEMYSQELKERLQRESGKTPEELEKMIGEISGVKNERK